MSYVWWVPPFFACLPSWIPYLVVVYLLDQIRKTGFADPYKKRFQIYWYVSLVAFAFGVRARSITVETPIQRLIDLFVLVGVSFAVYYFIEDVTEIFRREQISPKTWPGIRKLAIVVLFLQVVLSFLFAFHQFSGFQTSKVGLLGVFILLYVVAGFALVALLHTATSAAGPFLENRLQYGTVVPIEPRGNPEDVHSPFQFNLMTMFFLTLGSACAVEYWNQAPPLNQIVVKEATVDGDSLRLHIAKADQQAKLIIVERSGAPFADRIPTRRAKRRYLLINNTKVWARRVPRMYFYDREENRFRRLKLPPEARRDASRTATSASDFWETYVAPQLASQ